jgi:hypothetical protein
VSAVDPGVKLVTLAFRGALRLDPAAGYEHAEGEAWQFLFYAGDRLFDAMVCYAHTDRCALVNMQQTPDGWSATPSEGVPDVTPFVLHYRVEPAGDWLQATHAALRITTLGVGEVGATTLERDDAVAPPPGVRERLRAEQMLRTIYEAIALRYEADPPAERHFPEPHAPPAGPLPCGPVRVDDAGAVAWLGLRTPALLDWAYSVETDATGGKLRVVARRDRDCKGDVETLVLDAHLDEYGDLERDGVVPPPAQ